MMHHSRPISTVVTDILGTILNKHCTALKRPFLKSFENFGVPITHAEMNKPTGIQKNEHICEILQMPDVIARFEKEKKRRPNIEEDTKAIFKLYEPLQIATLSDPSFIRPLPGLQELKAMKIKLVATTRIPWSMGASNLGKLRRRHWSIF